ncbi:hypothetical protein CSB45_09580 [candidate division KSB3 bacterium]|uniref:DUF4845 domain-containing protein n=1 Tax=candidate division KSB3 bacterium TaxID=2044937 RepID=A0A2G6E498_9BACT|nr:MAG: hypothetical protein CSB45_09580 [candidate division KSB3 bacterium]PIE29432.1 MAG: hypothetical protein CSA57_08495 [candidate division KSB3 bacterium]
MKIVRKSMLNAHGGARLSAMIAIAIVAICIFVGAQLIPIYWGHYSLEDELKTLAQFAFVNYSGQKIQNIVFQETKKGLDELGATYKDKDVKVQVNNEKKKIIIDVVYTMNHKVPFFTNPWPLELHVENN